MSFPLPCMVGSANDATVQDATGLHVGAAVATIKRNARGVVTGFRESKIAKAGDGLMRRCEVQVRLDMDGSSVYLYPDQLNVLSSLHPLKQSQPQPQAVAMQQRLPPPAAKEARTLDSSVVNAAVRFRARVLNISDHVCRCAILLQLSAVLAPRVAAAR
jgi:hypothetical protein